MSLEAKVISSVCQHKDINILLAEDADKFFVTHGDVWDFIKNHWYKYRDVPSVDVVEDEHRDFDPQPVDAPTGFYFDQLRNDYLKRGLRNLLLDKGRKLDELPAGKILDEMYAELSDLNRMSTNVRDLDLTDYEEAEKFYEKQRKRSEEMGGSPGIPTGIAAIDASYTTGMAPGHLIVVIGWSGKGKTWFASYLACKAWEQGFKPMIVSLEMSPEDMRSRIYTIMGSGLFKNSQFSNGSVDLDQFKNWAVKRFSQQNNFVIVSNEGVDSFTPNMVQSKIDQHRPDIVICDYNQLFDDNRHSQQEVQRNRNISREFKLLAMSNQIPVVNLTQATQDDVADTQEPPLIEHVAWSKGIQHDADLAIAAHKHPDSNFFEVISRKTRHGSDFAFGLDWDIDNGVIKEIFA